MVFTEEQILSLAPDESSKKSGKELANASKWGKRHVSARALWGECQGSGKLPYQTQVDLVNVAFKCTCPSRKFPCKHGLGLMLLYFRDQKLFNQSPEPDWVTGWLDRRTEKEEKKIEKKVKERSVDSVAQAKRQENRSRRVEEGMADLRLWVADIIRNGLLNMPARGAEFYEGMARRMVDAQAPGLASMVRALGNVNFFQDGWQTPFLDQLIRIYLLLEGFPRLIELPVGLQAEVKTLIGFSQNQDEIKSKGGIRDDWFVLAKQSDREENLTIEKNWLYGLKSQRFALLLQFYVKGQLPEVNLLAGSWVDAELCFFKGAFPVRALLKEQFGLKKVGVVEGVMSWSEAMEVNSKVMAVNPFLDSFPVVIDQVIPMRQDNRWLLRDAHGGGVTLSHSFKHSWKLMALSGGLPIRVFAVGKEQTFEPIGVWVNDKYKLL
jgi:hypothetical protein